MTRCRIVGVSIALLALFTAQTCASAAKSPLGMVYDHDNAVRVIESVESEKPVRAPAMPPIKDDEIDVQEKVTVHIKGPIFGHRDIEEEITKRYKLAPRPVQFLPAVVYPPPMQYHNPMPAFQPAPPPAYFGPMMSGFGSGWQGGGIQNCGPSG